MTEQELREVIREELSEAASDNREALEALESAGGIQSVHTLPMAPGLIINFDWGGSLEIQPMGDELNLILKR